MIVFLEVALHQKNICIFWNNELFWKNYVKDSYSVNYLVLFH